MTEDLNLKAMREVASKATPGPWRNAGGYLTTRDPDGASFTRSVEHLDEMGQSGLLPFQAVPFARQEDALHIATFDPPTCLALIDALTASLAREGRLREALERIEDRANFGQRGQFRAIATIAEAVLNDTAPLGEEGRQAPETAGG